MYLSSKMQLYILPWKSVAPHVTQRRRMIYTEDMLGGQQWCHMDASVCAAQKQVHPAFGEAHQGTPTSGGEADWREEMPYCILGFDPGTRSTDVFPL